ncbi:MAG TPA: type II toxin-antitoxin system VapC family toxin [Pyrinomonadaceae bacterium]|nr:type II toxin-antitoxin system VapC family toxin [Pyrinomonadaceae bacterium]
MMYLVDANVLSEPTKQTADSRVVDWLTANEANLVVDPIIIGELRTGILALPRGRKREKLEKWFEAVVETIECLPWDATVSRRWATLVVDLKRRGETVPLLDGMIAATALEHDLIVATRNTRDFKKTGVKAFNPFE